MAHRPKSDPELVSMYLRRVLDGVLGMEEFIEEMGGEDEMPVNRRQLYRWKGMLQDGEEFTIQPASRRGLIRALGLGVEEVLPYPDSTSRAS